MPVQRSTSRRAPTLVETLLELGDATSRNLEFAHRHDVFVSYGEETITEQNLLEIRRRHQHQIHVKTFPRREEAKNWADWEWHIIGTLATLKMRVQAKRVQRDDRLRIKHRVASSGAQQRELLLRESCSAGMKPTYCIYCTQAQRVAWQEPVSINRVDCFQAGCLLVDAHDVPETTADLPAIEEYCVPWHYLSIPRHYSCPPEITPEARKIVGRLDQAGRKSFDGEIHARWNVPSVAQLNGHESINFRDLGVHETNQRDLQSAPLGVGYNQRALAAEYERLSEQGVHRWVVIDVRQEERFEERTSPDGNGE